LTFVSASRGPTSTPWTSRRPTSLIFITLTSLYLLSSCSRAPYTASLSGSTSLSSVHSKPIIIHHFSSPVPHICASSSYLVPLIFPSAYLVLHICPSSSLVPLIRPSSSPVPHICASSSCLVPPIRPSSSLVPLIFLSSSLVPLIYPFSSSFSYIFLFLASFEA